MKRTIYKKYTPSGVSIDHRIRTGKTFFFDTIEEAREKARTMRSYYYNVFNSSKRHIGYAVPK